MDGHAILIVAVGDTVMGWPLNGDWDRATTPPGASTADLAAIMCAICIAVKERDDLLGLGSGFNPVFYTNTHPSGTSFPTPLDLQGIEIRQLIDIGGHDAGGLKYKSVVNNGIRLIASSNPGDPTYFYKEPTCTTLYGYGEILSTAEATVGASYSGTNEVMNATDWLIMKEMLNLMIYAKIAGVPTDLSSSLADQS